MYVVFVRKGVNMELLEQAKRIKEASYTIMNASTEMKNQILASIIEELSTHTNEILTANQKDLTAAKQRGMKDNLLDRMRLDEVRIKQILVGIQQVIELHDPVRELIEHDTLANGLKIAQLRVPLGVIGMIYEARPNVTVDAAVLALKSGNACFLRGSKDILETNKVLVSCMRQALHNNGFPDALVSLVENPSHEQAEAFMRLHGYLDVLIPRGGARLIKECVDKASVPLLETGTGNCHVYVDQDGDLSKALPIIINAKTQRTSVCNACESVLLHEAIVNEFAKPLIDALKEHQVIIHGDASITALDGDVISATDEDYGREYLAMEISIKVVSSIEEAITHINHYSTHHSEAIITENLDAMMKFLSEVDSACVYANASTRFSDGFEFGLGAEIGISTQKLHARGPMGLEALTSLKYIIQGTGQIRE